MDSAIKIEKSTENESRLVDKDKSDILIIDTDEEDLKPYLNAHVFEIHRTSKADEVDRAIDVLCAEFGKNTTKFKVHLKTLVCDLFYNYSGCKERYLSIGLAKVAGKFKLISRYNRFRIGYRLLHESINHLKGHGYIEYKKGYLKKGFANGFQTRIRATEKLIGFLTGYGVSEEMIHVYQDQELIIRKKRAIEKKIITKNRQGKVIKPKVKVKLLDDYNDTNHTKRWRNTLEQYNELIARTYIDIDLTDYKPKKERKRFLYFDLSRKRTKRSFSNGNFESGGRFYGGFWQGVPSDMRPYLLINGRHVVENDFSGMHIHILYAMIGKRFSDTGLEPYMVPKHNDPEGKRPYYKKLLLSAFNATTPRDCISAVKKDIKKNPGDYPQGDYDLYAMLKEISAYHPDLEGFLQGEKGLYSQYIDSCIAYRVIKEMTGKNIPVLCIHDSFISADKHADIVLDCMKRSYVEELNLLLKRRGFELKLTVEDAITDETAIIQRKVDVAISKIINTIDKLQPLEIVSREVRKYNQISEKPLFQTVDRDSIYHLARTDLKIDIKQKRRQVEWLASGKKQAIFNETVIVNTKGNVI